jgi:hypothetical protein
MFRRKEVEALDYQEVTNDIVQQQDRELLMDLEEDMEGLERLYQGFVGLLSDEEDVSDGL